MSGRITGGAGALSGISSARNPEVAGEFAGLAARQGQGSGQDILPLLHRAKRPAILTLRGDEKAHEVQATLEDAFSQGCDSFLLKNCTTPGGTPKQEVVIDKDPAQLRSRFAAFDPAKADITHVLALRTHDVAAIQRKGARPLLEFLNEISARHGEEFIAERLTVYASIDDAALDMLDARDIRKPDLWSVAA